MKISILFLFIAIFPCTTHATTYETHGNLIGKIQYYTVKEKDTLYTIARKFDVGIVELLSANPKANIWKPKIGTELIIPTQHILPQVAHEGIIANLSELRLYYFTADNNVMTFPVAIGKKNWETRQGETSIIMKVEHPSWTPPQSIREENPDLPDIIPAGKNNPLGDYAIKLGWQNYVIHGTNKPYSVGKRASHGCIRMYPEDIAQLFSAISVGTKVTVIDTEYKLSWHGINLFIEVNYNQEQSDIVAQNKIPKIWKIKGLDDGIKKIAGNNANIDWEAVKKAATQKNGVPTVIGTH